MIALALTPLACSGTKTPTGSSPVVQPPAPIAVTTVTITGTAPIVGASAQFDAMAAMSNGTASSVTSQAAWTSSDSSVATVTAAGVVRGVGAGDADIVASYQSVSGRLHITVSAPRPPTPCTYALSIGSTIEGYPNGGSFPVTVITLPGCAWTATTDGTWIHLPSPASGTGTSTLTFTADANAGAPRTATLVIAGITVVFTQSSQAPPPPPASEGLRSDTIHIGHDFIVGSPTPTQNQTATYCCWPLPVLNGGSYRYNLDSFPANVLPSGGSSNIVSASEMLFVGVRYAGVATSSTRMAWHKAVGTDTVIATYATSSSHSWVYSFIGHFSWEISEPGQYYLTIDSQFGSVRMDFNITGSRTSVVTERRATGAPTAVAKGGYGIDPTSR